jgi:hypothetical protein
LGHHEAPKKKRGGAIGGMSDMRMKRSHEGEDDLRSEGGRSPKRYRKGGKVPHQTNIAIVIPHHKPALGAQDAAGAMMGAPPPAMGGPTPTLAPPGPPGMPPPMRKHGGKVVMGEDPPEDIANYRQARQRGGATSGVNRLDEYHRLRGKG